MLICLPMPKFRVPVFFHAKIFVLVDHFIYAPSQVLGTQSIANRINNTRFLNPDRVDRVNSAS